MIKALKQGNLDAAALPDNERALLEFAQILTERPAQVCDDDVATLRRMGWSDAQMAEAVYIIALFAFFNRVADAFGLQDPNYEGMLGKPAGR